MATRFKTIEYWFNHLGSLPDNANTALSQITVYIPETIVAFRSVVAEVIVADQYTTAGNVTQRQIQLTLQGAAAGTVNNTQTLTQSGENFIHMFSGDFTGYFTTNWTGTSRTLDCSLLVNTTATGSANASVKVTISYTYDDTATTQIKTVWIPLNAPVGAMPTTKGAAIDTIPALDTYCPEASKTFRQTTIVVQGNQESASTTDMSLSMEVDTAGALTTVAYEKGSSGSGWYRTNRVVSFTTNATHSFYLWASAADFDHPQAWLVVTYEFDESSTTTTLKSLLLPAEFSGPMGGPTSSDYQRVSRDLWLQDGGTITTLRLAVLVFWEQFSAMTGLNARLGTGSFVAYSSVAVTACGGFGNMVRNDSAFTLARGKNTLTADIYNTDTGDLGFSLSAMFMVNYTSSMHADGPGAENHTVIRNLRVVGTAAASAQTIVSSIALDIPETGHFKNSLGLNYIYTTNSTAQAAGVHIGVERLASGEGGLIWENVYECLGGTDPEVGIRQSWATARSVFRRWADGSVIDADASRLSIETARRWRLASAAASFDHLDVYLTYHTIDYVISGTVSGSGGGTVTLHLCRADTGERVMTTTRTGNGAYSFNWFDDTEDMYVEAYESATLKGRTKQGTPATDFDVNLASGGGGAVEHSHAFIG